MKYNDDTTMQWGRYAGQRLGDIPDSYFRWFLMQNWHDDHPKLVEYANQIVEE